MNILKKITWDNKSELTYKIRKMQPDIKDVTRLWNEFRAF